MDTQKTCNLGHRLTLIDHPSRMGYLLRSQNRLWPKSNSFGFRGSLASTGALTNKKSLEISDPGEAVVRASNHKSTAASESR